MLATVAFILPSQTPYTSAHAQARSAPALEQYPTAVFQVLQRAKLFHCVNWPVSFLAFE